MVATFPPSTLAVDKPARLDTYLDVTNKERAGLKRKLRANAIRDPKTSCWVWQRSLRRPKGYGQVRWKGSIHQAHRMAYKAYKSDILDIEVVHHICSNNQCINPRHLQAVSAEQNVAEMLERRKYQQQIERLTAEVARLKAKQCACAKKRDTVTV